MCVRAHNLSPSPRTKILDPPLKIINTSILLVVFCIPGFGLALLYLPSFCLIHDYFPKSFISVSTITQFGTTLGALTFPVIVERSLEAYGYTGAFLILGAICLNALPMGAALRRRKDGVSQSERKSNRTSPEEMHTLLEKEDGTDNPDDIIDHPKEKSRTGSDLGDLFSILLRKLKTSFPFEEPLYVLSVPVTFFASYVLYPWMLFLVPHAEWQGIETSRAVFLSSIAGICGIFAKLSYLLFLRLNIDAMLFFCLTSPVCALSFFINSISPSYTYQAVLAGVQGFSLFALEGLPPSIMKLSIKKESNIPSASASNNFIYGAGVVIGDLLSGIYKNQDPCQDTFIVTIKRFE